MPFANLVLVLLLGLVPAVIAIILLKSRGLVFIVNIILGAIGSAIGAFAPVIISNALTVDVSTPSYLIRALAGGFALVLLATLFRPANTEQMR